MKRIIISLLCAAALTFCLSASVLAYGDIPLLCDDADLLTESEESSLLSLLEDISDKHGMDVVIVTVSSIGSKSVQSYADDFYDYNGYGEDGILLLIDMEYSDWYISTAGYGITAVTDAGLEYIAEQFLPDLRSEFYYDAFVTYAELCDEFVDRAKTGDPYGADDLPKEPFNIIMSLVISLAVGFVSALIVTGIMKGKLKTVRSADHATAYIKSGSLNITHSREIFLYSHISRIAKPKDTGSSGSRTHRSSSGRIHGGGGGKF